MRATVGMIPVLLLRLDTIFFFSNCQNQTGSCFKCAITLSPVMRHPELHLSLFPIQQTYCPSFSDRQSVFSFPSIIPSDISLLSMSLFFTKFLVHFISYSADLAAIIASWRDSGFFILTLKTILGSLADSVERTVREYSDRSLTSHYYD